MEKLKSKKNLIIIALISVVILGLGGTFAFFTFFKPVEAFVLTMNGVPMQVEFKDGTNVIDNPYAYPISDSFAKENLSKLGYVDFTVSGGTPNNEYLYYELYLTEENGNTLDPKYIKVYLTDTDGNVVVSPSIYNDLEQSTSENRNGKILYDKTLTGIFDKTYRLYVWIDSTYSQNQEHQTFAFKVNLYAYNTEEPKIAVEAIKEKLGTDGLVGVTTNSEKVDTTEGDEIREYRYSGPTVNNYVYFNCQDGLEQNRDNCETWRIIGIFKDEDDNEHMKIVRNEVLKKDVFPVTYTAIGKTYKIQSGSVDSAYWNRDSSDSGNDDWTTAGLMNWLNSKGASGGYLNSLTGTAQKMIYEATWYLGNVYLDDTTVQSYENERNSTKCSVTSNSLNSNCYIWPDNNATWNGNVGLMYQSDYGFTIDSSYWNTKKLNSDYQTFRGSSWLYNDANHLLAEWLLSPASFDSYGVAFWYLDGTVSRDAANCDYGVRPTLYLKSDVKITSGDGSINNQYKLSE